MYLMNTQPYIFFVVNTLSWYMVDPKHPYLLDTNHMMRYLKGTINYGLSYTRYHDFRVYGYTNLDWEGNVSDRKSTSGGCLILGQP